MEFLSLSLPACEFGWSLSTWMLLAFGMCWVLNILSQICSRLLSTYVTSQISEQSQWESGMAKGSCKDPDVIVVGSGITGSALAATLGKQGRKVTVIERDLGEPKKIAGEVLQTGGAIALKKLGLFHCIKDIDAMPLTGYKMYDTGQSERIATLDAPKERQWSLGIRHGRLVMQLRKAAKAQSTVTYLEGSVKQLLKTADRVNGVTYTDKETGLTKDILAPLVFVCDGTLSNLRKHVTTDIPSKLGYYLGIELETPSGDEGYLHFIPGEPNHMYVYPIDSSHTRVLMEILPHVSIQGKDKKAFVIEEILKNIPAFYLPAFREAIETNDFQSAQSWHLPCNPMTMPGMWPLGDVLNLRHPNTATGMLVALNDIIVTRDLLQNVPDLSDVESVSRAQRHFFSARRAYSDMINVFAMYIFQVTTSHDKYMKLAKSGLVQTSCDWDFLNRGNIAMLTAVPGYTSVTKMMLYLNAATLCNCWMLIRQDMLLPRALYKCAAYFMATSKILYPLLWAELYKTK